MQETVGARAPEHGASWPARLLLVLAWINLGFLALETLINILEDALRGGVPLG